MRSWLTLAAALVLSVLWASCSASMGTYVEEANIPKVRRCKTTKSEVLQLFGEPFTRGLVDDLQFWHWSYVQDSPTGNPTVQDLYITMDRRDVVVDLAYNPPESYYPKNKCGE